MSAVDFKGNMLEKSRRVIADAPILAAFEQAPDNAWRVMPFQVDWQTRPQQTLADRERELLKHRRTGLPGLRRLEPREAHAVPGGRFSQAPRAALRITAPAAYNNCNWTIPSTSSALRMTPRQRTLIAQATAS